MFHQLDVSLGVDLPLQLWHEIEQVDAFDIVVGPSHFPRLFERRGRLDVSAPGRHGRDENAHKRFSLSQREGWHCLPHREA